MLFITMLPADVWFLIAEYLSLGDLSLIYETFTGMTSSVDIPSIFTMQAIKTVSNLVISGTSYIETIIIDAKDQRPQLYPISGHKRKRNNVRALKPYPFATGLERVNGSPRFASNSQSESSLELSVSNIEDPDEYMPLFHGMNPTRLIQARVCIYATSDRLRGRLELEYIHGQRTRTALQDMDKDPIFLTRTLRRRLYLNRAIWNAYPLHRLPMFWFDHLGGWIYATITLGRKRNISQGMELDTTSSFIPLSLSILFPKISLPATKSLVDKVIPEVIIHQMST